MDSSDVTLAFLNEDKPFPKAHPPSCFQRWRGRIVSTIGGATSIAVRAASIAPWTSAISSFGIGFSAESLFESFIPRRHLVTVQRVAMTVLGQMSLFMLTQVYENSESTSVKTAMVDTIIGFLGANAFMYIKQFYLNRPNRVESHVVQRQNGERFQGIFLSSAPFFAAKVGLSGLCAYGAFTIEDYVYKTLSAFGATFFASEVVGNLTSKFFDRKIKETDSDRGTRWRTVKNIFIFLGAIAIPASLIPWKGEALSTKRQAQLPFIGGVLGFFQGIWNGALRRKFRHVPIEELQEMQKAGPSNENSRFWRKLYNIYQVAVPTVFISGLTAFFAWQIGWDLGDDQDAKDAFTSLFVGFLGAFGIGTFFDRTWDPKVRNKAKDFMELFLVIPTALGCSIAFFYSIFTNAINMADRGMTREYKWLQNVAWGSYGVAMALELIKTSGKRVGALLIPPLLVFVNGSLTLQRRLIGQIP